MVSGGANHLVFEKTVAFDPAGDFEAFLKTVPAKWVVYLMSDSAGRPVQLLCVKNLRASLRRRLGEGEVDQGPSKRVNYRELIRRVAWRRVDSRFEADLVYLEAARAIFPETYQGMIGFRYAWFVHVDPAAQFPRYVKTIDLENKSGGVLIGPVEDKHAAGKLIEMAENAFDLCRYYSVLVEAPRGKACAYKEMGKCPAPCDGTISMEQYRGMVKLSSDTVVDAGDFIRAQTKRMQQAAAELKFEQAGKIKAFIDSLQQFGKGPYRHARRLEDFVYVSVQKGPWEGTAKVFLVTPGEVEEVAGMIGDPGKSSEELWRFLLERAEGKRKAGVDRAGAERVGVVSHHLFTARNAQGVFVRLDEVDERTMGKAYRDLAKQATVEEEEGDGGTKHLQDVGEGERSEVGGQRSESET